MFAISLAINAASDDLSGTRLSSLLLMSTVLSDTEYLHRSGQKDAALDSRTCNAIRRLDLFDDPVERMFDLARNSKNTGGVQHA